MASRKLLSLAAVCAALVPGVVVASGCGAEDAAGVDVAKAASATGAKGTAKIDLDVQIKGFGLPGSLNVKGNGVTALAEPRLDLTLALGEVASMLGLPVDDADIRLKVDGKDVYVRPPALPGLTLPGGATWAALDLKKAAEGLGIDTDGLGALFSVDPSTQLRTLRRAKGLKEVGEEEIGGAKTTHLKGTITSEDLIAALPADAQKQAREAARKLGAAETLDDPMPIELWVDEDDVVRRMVQGGKIPSQQGMPAGEVRIAYELSDFGAKLDTSAPPAKDTYQATEPLLRIFKQFGGGSLGAAPGGTSKTD